jgi:predicted small lipoprotein YifL
MTSLIGRTDEALRGLRAAPRSPLLPRLIILAALAAVLAGCGVKNELVKPNGQSTSRDGKNPSQPPYPLGH